MLRVTPYGSVLQHDQCVWCYSPFSQRKKYAFGLCLTCYRWFRRYLNKTIIHCSLCGKPIKVYQKGLCLECKKRLGVLDKSTKRTDNIKSKFLQLVPQFESLPTKEDAEFEFSDFFNSRQQKLLDIALERYYDGTSLREIGERYECTREYIRQCETTALKIIAKNTQDNF